MKKERIVLVDMLKCIGIVSIVIGHGMAVSPFLNLPLGAFVQNYHIMIFLFVAGFLFSEKNAQKPISYIYNRFKKLMWLTIVFSFIFILLHNCFCSLNMIDSSYYSFSDMLNKFGLSMIWFHMETLLGTFWFIPMFFFATAIFAIMFSIARATKKPVYLHLFFILLTMTAGLLLNVYHITIIGPWHIQISLLGIPIIYLGYFVKLYWNKLEKYFTGGETLLALFLLILINKYVGWNDLASNHILNPYLFYPVSIVAIGFCIGLAKLFSRSKTTTEICCYIGKHSFDIMALHFMSFKLIDIIYGAITNAQASAISRFPQAFDLNYLYVIVGIVLPLLIMYFYQLGKKFLLIALKKISHLKAKPHFFIRL